MIRGANLCDFSFSKQFVGTMTPIIVKIVAACEDHLSSYI